MNKLISCFLAVVMIFANTSFIYSADKKDVADPVLKEMISELSNTMPRFINKYGANVFVSDEQITRAALIQALYEYNKNNKSAAVTPSSNIGFVSKDDFNLLKNKVTALEKKSVGGSSSSSVSSNMDIIQIMNDLEPNMPMLLDNSLQNSKVFKDLQKKVDTKVASVGGGIAGSGIPSAQLESIKSDITSLSQKYDSLSASLTSGKDSKMSSSQLSANIAVLQKEIAGINVKLATLQDTVKNSSVQEQNKSSDLASLKQEMANLKTKVTSIDTTMLASSKGAKTANVSSQEITKLNEEIANLKAKVSSMDTTMLANSKGAKTTNVSPQEIKNLSDEVETLKKTVIQAQKSYVDVAKRVNSLEDRPVVSSSGTGANSSQIGYLESKINSIKKTVDNVPTNEYVQTQISKSNSKTSTDIKKIENRLNELEKNKSSYKSSSDSNSSSGSSAGTITKISLGLTLVAALFIAR